jgi:thioredoxin 1
MPRPKRFATDHTIDDAIIECVGIMLVYFWIPGCELCRSMSNAIDTARSEFHDCIDVLYANMEEAAATAGRMGIQSPPVLIVVNRGRLVQRFDGAISVDALIKVLREHLKHPKESER